MMHIRIWFSIVSFGAICAASQHALAQQATFIHNGRVIAFDANIGKRELFASRLDGLAPREFETYWGTLADGRLALTEKAPHAAKESPDDPDHHCLDESPARVLYLLSPDGAADLEIYPETLRAYPSPSSSMIAIISPRRDFLLWRDDKITTVPAPGKVSNVGWSPDGKRFVASVYPPDWSEGAVSTAKTTVEFLRLQNADLYLYDVEKGEFVSQLSSDPGTEYGAFFSPDGSKVYYSWLHLMEDEGGLMELNLDRDGGSTASLPVRQLTHAGNEPGEIPLGRVTTYQWLNGGSELAFESGLPDGSGEIWTMKADGSAPVRHTDGRKPQRISDDAIAFIKADGKIQVYRSEVKP